jgi:hypothetical protein
LLEPCNEVGSEQRRLNYGIPEPGHPCPREIISACQLDVEGGADAVQTDSMEEPPEGWPVDVVSWGEHVPSCTFLGLILVKFTVIITLNGDSYEAV